MVVFVLFCWFCSFALVSDVPEESVFVVEGYEVFEEAQGKSHRSRTTLWACWTRLKLMFYFKICIIFECHRVVSLSQLINGRRWLYFPMGNKLISLNLMYWFGSAKCYIYNCLAMLRNISSLMGWIIYTTLLFMVIFNGSSRWLIVL